MDMSLSKLRETVEDRAAWCAAVHGATKSQIRLSAWRTNEYMVARELPSLVMTVSPRSMEEELRDKTSCPKDKKDPHSPASKLHTPPVTVSRLLADGP